MKNKIAAFFVSFIVLCSLMTTTVFAEKEVPAYYDNSKGIVAPTVQTPPAPAVAEDGNSAADTKPAQSVDVDTSPAAELVEPVQDDWNDKMGEILSSACDWVRNSEQGKLYLLCMGAAGKSAISANVNQYISEVALRKEYNEPILLPYDILNVTFSGYSANNILGKDLITQLADSYEQLQKADLYTISYTLLAINSNRYTVANSNKNSPQNLAKLLLELQNPDGGFSSRIGEPSAVIQTGLALTALSPYYTDPEFTTHIDSGLNFISSQQQPDGSFLDNGAPSSVADSKVVITLNSLKISLHDNRFVKNENTALTPLMLCLTSDGGFSQTAGGKSEVIATENAILALSSIKKKHSPYELDTMLYANTKKAAENIVLSNSHKISISRPILYILLGALVLTLLAFMIVSKFHPFKYIEKIEEKRQETQ